MGCFGVSALGRMIAIEPIIIRRVNRFQALQHQLHRVRQLFKRLIHVGPHRVASRTGCFVNLKDASHGRLSISGHIRVPALPIISLGRSIRMNAHQRGVISDKGGCRMNVKFPKPLAERQVFGGGEPWALKKKH